MTENFGTKSDIIIIGAGISGLTSALKIQQKAPALKLTILEASNHAGGQLRSTHLGEIGAKWLTEDQVHFLRLLEHLDIPTSTRSVSGCRLNKYWEMDDIQWGKLAKFELLRYLSDLDLKMDSFKTEVHKSRLVSMHSHIHKRLFFTCSRKFMKHFIMLATGVDSYDISYVDFMNICHSCGGVKRLIDLLIEAPTTLLEFSSEDLLKSLLRKLKYVTISYSRKVCSIYQYRDFVEVRDEDNKRYTADVIILAVPRNCWHTIKFWPPLPIEIRSPTVAAEAIKYVVTSFLANYTEPYWSIRGYSGHFVGMEPLLVANEYRPATICGFCVHEEGLEPILRPIILHKMADKFGEGMLLPIEFQQHTFELNALNHMALTTPWNRVIWSSSAAAGTCYRGYLSGAVQSGLRAAMNALLLTRPQTVDWQDLSEIQCHKYLPRKDMDWFSQRLSSWNLYNVSTYTIFICGVVTVLYISYKKH